MWNCSAGYLKYRIPQTGAGRRAPAPPTQLLITGYQRELEGYVALNLRATGSCY
jgi:hypothetical protein